MKSNVRTVSLNTLIFFAGTVFFYLDSSCLAHVFIFHAVIGATVERKCPKGHVNRPMVV